MIDSCIDNEIISTRKVSSFIYIYIMVILIIVLSLIILTILLDYTTYLKCKGIVIYDNDHYYINIYVNLDSASYITKNNIIYLDDKPYSYNVVLISDDYVTDNINTYQIIKIDLELPEEDRYNNLSLDLKLVKEKKKIINYLLKKGRL